MAGDSIFFSREEDMGIEEPEPRRRANKIGHRITEPERSLGYTQRSQSKDKPSILCKPIPKHADSRPDTTCTDSQTHREKHKSIPKTAGTHTHKVESKQWHHKIAFRTQQLRKRLAYPTNNRQCTATTTTSIPRAISLPSPSLRAPHPYQAPCPRRPHPPMKSPPAWSTRGPDILWNSTPYTSEHRGVR
jgi:hypothetical protein